MRSKPSAGWVAVIAASVMPMLLWLAFKDGSRAITFDNVGRLCGLTGLALLSINVILSGRLRIFDRMFRGLDHMYRVHYQLGCWALIFLLLHATFITLGYASISLAAGYKFLTDFSSIPLIMGKVGLAILSAGIIFVLYMWINYQWFVRTMRILGIVAFIGGFHAINVPGSDIRSITPLFLYMSLLGLGAAIVYVYRSLFHRPLHRRFNYEVASVTPHGNVTEIWLKPLGRKLEHYAGQFAFLTFSSKTVAKETHPFTISSGSNDENVRFCIKQSGDFTATLPKLKVGDRATLEAPYGQFSYTKVGSTKQVWIAGGIGITPFLSMSRSLQNGYDVDLYWSVKTADELVFLDQLKEAAKKYPGLKIHPHVTDKSGFLTADVVAKTSDISDHKVLLCGPPAMMKALEKQFVDLGTSKKDIYYEEFAL